MADAILGQSRIDGKPMPIAFNTTSTAGALTAPPNLTAVTMAGGLVCHDYVDIDVQVTILAVVDDTGSATLEEIVAALAGHPKPAGAAFAMVAAGILCIEDGIVDANSRLSRTPLLDGGDDDTPDGAPQCASGGDDDGSGDGGADYPGPGEMRQISVAVPYAPAIFCIPGLERRLLRTEPLLGDTGIYAAIWGGEVYVGASKNLVARLTKGPHLVTPRLADRIIAIVDGTRQLSWDGAQVAERLLYRQLIASGELKPRNEEPNGGRVDEVEYELVHDFVEIAMQALRREGLASPVPPASRTPAANQTARAQQTLFATRVERQERQVGLYRLDACGVKARARVVDNSWTLLAGSAIRSEVMPSAHPSAKQRRIELLHSGGLVKKGRDYMLTRDLDFASATGAAHFVVGSKTRADIWSAVDAAQQPARLH